jgi:hypothetical protein
MHRVYLVSQDALSVGRPTDGVRDSLSTGCALGNESEVHDPRLPGTLPFGSSSLQMKDASVSWSILTAVPT